MSHLALCGLVGRSPAQQGGSAVAEATKRVLFLSSRTRTSFAPA
jgi:hypothetical protein